MNDIQIFNNPEFGEIRTVVIDGEPWFVGVDIAKALGYQNPQNAIKNHVEDEDRKVGEPNATPYILDSLGRKQYPTLINESGLYSLFFGSKLESAKKFKHWATSEVLPQIRKTGTYAKPQLPQTPMELLELHYEAIKQVDKKVEAVDIKVEDVKAELENFKQDMPIFGVDENRITTAVHRKGVEVLGGKMSNAYNDKSLHDKVFRDIYREVKLQFGITGTYKQIKRSQCDKAIEIIGAYQPPLFLADQIENCNAQMKIE